MVLLDSVIRSINALVIFNLVTLLVQNEIEIMAAVYTDSNFDAEVLKADKPAMVDFWAPWCGPCIAIGPTVEALAHEYEGKVNVGKVNVDENPNLSIEFGITSIPCILFMKDGKVVDKHLGMAPRNVLDKKLQKLIS
jgi:thioredoxin 1